MSYDYNRRIVGNYNTRHALYYYYCLQVVINNMYTTCILVIFYTYKKNIVIWHRQRSNIQFRLPKINAFMFENELYYSYNYIVYSLHIFTI
jgi:hypothetical protein